MKLKYLITLTSLVLLTITMYGQNLTQTVRGQVIDNQSKTTLPGVNIIVLDVNPVIGAVSDKDGFDR